MPDLNFNTYKNASKLPKENFLLNYAVATIKRIEFIDWTETENRFDVWNTINQLTEWVLSERSSLVLIAQFVAIKAHSFIFCHIVKHFKTIPSRLLNLVQYNQ